MAKYDGDVQMTAIEHVETMQTDNQDHDFMDAKLRASVLDGDAALKLLHTHYEPYTKEEEKKVLRKIDLRLVVVMLVVNGIQFIDKQTISQAATYGIAKQADLVGQQFSLLISLFYIAYLIAQYPANLLMQRYPAGKVITICFLLWGATLAASGAAKNFATLAVARFFLGIFESCVNPGFVLITSSWWKREEQIFRVGLWYCANGVFGAPSGIIFWAIAHMNVDHMFAYQWMFIFFGLFTVLFGTCLWWFLPANPMAAAFLTEREKIIAIERLKDNKTGISNTHHKPEQLKELVGDLKVWLLVLGIFWHNMTNPLQTTFQGIVIKGFGYSTYDAVLLSIPSPVIVAITVVVVTFFLSSKWGDNKRIFVIIACYIPGLVATIMLKEIPVNAHTKGSHLFAIFLIAPVAAAAGIQYSLLAANVAGYTKKTAAGALFFISYAVANIVAPQCFIAKQAPHYTTGITVCLVAYCLNIVIFGLLYVLYRRENAKRNVECADLGEMDETEDMVNGFSDLTDKQNKRFRYKM